MTCAVKYPVILVHGIAVPDALPLISYWGQIPSHLQQRGAQVFLSRHPAWGDHEDNAALLKDRILEICNLTGAKKVNIIAHSKGGIESRYMISRLEMAPFVASLTTISTPHRGSVIADYIYNQIDMNEINGKLIVTIVATVGILFGDMSPDPEAAGRALTTTHMADFNKEVPDMPQVYYQSYTSVITENYPAIVWQKIYKLHYELDGPNDGLVSERSAQWGDYKGIVTVGSYSELNHADIVGLYQFSGRQIPQLHTFYVSVVEDLKNRGF
ncbi:MAG: hypothetical protein PF637_13385 [Spirochaetes bacterium]|nr:hypothetical protein [Spirochaetota bacterium]